MAYRKEHRDIKLVPIQGNEDVNNDKVTLNYNEGGMNYSTYKTEQRGLYLVVKPVKLEEGNGFTSESFMMFSGIKALVLPMKRFNQKMLDTFVPDAETEKKLIDYVINQHNLKVL